MLKTAGRAGKERSQKRPASNRETNGTGKEPCLFVCQQAPCSHIPSPTPPTNCGAEAVSSQQYRSFLPPPKHLVTLRVRKNRSTCHFIDTRVVITHSCDCSVTSKHSLPHQNVCIYRDNYFGGSNRSNMRQTSVCPPSAL